MSTVLIAGRYRLIAPLGVGGGGKVFLAQDEELDRRVAIKVLLEHLVEDPAFLKRFRAEAKAAAALNHPNVMHLYDVGEDSSTGRPIPFLVMEFLGGGSLKEVIHTSGLLSPSQALMVGLDAARGLDYAHRQGFVHRDIKPANLLFGEEERLRIADFGLARAFSEASWTEPKDKVLGSIRYASPEQAFGRPADGKSDVYSLALTLVEAVTGSVPFSADTIVATQMARTESDLRVPKELGRLVSVLQWAGRLDPEQRPDAGELVIAFLEASESMDRPAPLLLPGAIRPEVLDEIIEHGASDITLLADPDVTALAPVISDSSPLQAAAAALSNIDIPLDTDPVPVLAATGNTATGVAESGTSSGKNSDGEGGDGARRWPWILATLLLVAALLGGGGYWWFAIRVPTHDVTKLVGLQQDAAKRRLSDLGYRSKITLVRRDNTTPNEVLEQSPKPGTELEEGKTVELTVSLGPTLVAPPALDSSMPEQAVIDAVTAAGLTVAGKETPFDETVPAGNFISLSAVLDPTGRLPRGSSVNIVISNGPAPRTIPEGLIGGSLAGAKKALADRQLKVDAAEEYSAQPSGVVLAVSPAANEQVARDSVVRVTVSKGPAPVAIPNVVGASVADATSTLSAAGFPVSGVDGSPAKPVIVTDPPAGELHVPGTPVRIVSRQ
jgi:serine/threonine-protein kinase